MSTSTTDVVAAAAPTFCQRLQKTIRDIENDLDKLPAKIDRLQAAIRKMQADPNADPATLAALKQALADAQNQLTSDQESLPLFQEDFDAMCVPQPPPGR